MLITLKCFLHKGQTWPDIKFSSVVQSTHLVDINPSTRAQFYDIELADNFLIVDYPEKPQSETVIDGHGIIIADQHIVISDILVDNISLDLAIIQDHVKFLPRYRPDFIQHCQQNNINLDTGPLNTFKLYHAGQWQWHWDHDFWTWYQQKRDDRKNKYHDIGKFSNIIGDDRHKIRNELDAFRKKFFPAL